MSGEIMGPCAAQGGRFHRCKAGGHAVRARGRASRGRAGRGAGAHRMWERKALPRPAPCRPRRAAEKEAGGPAGRATIAQLSLAVISGADAAFPANGFVVAADRYRGHRLTVLRRGNGAQTGQRFSTWEAPLTSPAMSTISSHGCTSLLGLNFSTSQSKRSSGTCTRVCTDNVDNCSSAE